jgi:hypothetical protein
MFLITFYRDNDDFVRVTKIVLREKNTVKVAPRKVTILQVRGATTWVKEDKTPNLGPFTRNPGVK